MCRPTLLIFTPISSSSSGLFSSFFFLYPIIHFNTFAIRINLKSLRSFANLTKEEFKKLELEIFRQYYSFKTYLPALAPTFAARPALARAKLPADPDSMLSKKLISSSSEMLAMRSSHRKK